MAHVARCPQCLPADLELIVDKVYISQANSLRRMSQMAVAHSPEIIRRASAGETARLICLTLHSAVLGIVSPKIKKPSAPSLTPSASSLPPLLEVNEDEAFAPVNTEGGSVCMTETVNVSPCQSPDMLGRGASHQRNPTEIVLPSPRHPRPSVKTHSLSFLPKGW